MSLINGQWISKSPRSSKGSGAKIIAPNGSILSSNYEKIGTYQDSNKSGTVLKKSSVQGSILSQTKSETLPHRSTKAGSVLSGVSNNYEKIGTNQDSNKSGATLKKSSVQGSILSQTKSETLPYRSSKAGSVLSGVSSQVARKKRQKESLDGLSQNMKERAMSVTSLNHRKSNGSGNISSHLKRYSQSDMSIAVKSEIQSMTKEERNALLAIIDKYKKLQDLENHRKSALNMKIKEIQSLRPPYSEFQSNLCYICQRTFWPIIYIKYSCSRCKIFVCKNCLKPYKDESVCNQCFQEMIYISKSDLLLKKRKYNEDSDSDENIDVNTLKNIIKQAEIFDNEKTYENLTMDQADAISKVSSRSNVTIFKKLLHKKSEDSIGSKKSRKDSNSNLSHSKSLSVTDMTVITSSDIPSPEPINTNHSCADREGEIMIGISYNYNLEEFQVLIKKCRNLEVAITNERSSNPYITFELVPRLISEKAYRTKTVTSNVNPEFNENYKYKNIKYEDVISRNLHLKIWHNETLGKDVFLGEVILKLNNFNLDDATPKWFQLKEKGPPVINPSLSKYYGDIEFSIKFTPYGKSALSIDSQSDKLSDISVIAGSIILWIKQGNNLLTSSYSNLPNSYAKCLLLPESSKIPSKKSQIIRKNFNPIWNLPFTFTNIPQHELPGLGIEITVWDKKNSLLHDKFLGGISLNISKNKRLVPANEMEVWQQMIAKPDTWIEAKLILRRDLK